MELITNKVKEKSGNFYFRALKERGQPVGGVGQPCSGLSMLYLQAFLFLSSPSQQGLKRQALSIEYECKSPFAKFGTKAEKRI